MQTTRRLVLAAAGLGIAGLGPAAKAEANAIALPPPGRGDAGSIKAALAQRRSVRSYAAQALALPEVAELLWAGQGISGDGGLRTAPSAGALYPLELHVIADRIDGLPAGVYRYAPSLHALQPRFAASLGARLMQAAGGQPALSAAPLVLAITAVQARTAAKYGARAGRYVAIEAGAAAQNVALRAASLDLGAVVVGAFDDDEVARALRLPPGERPFALMPLGRRVEAR